MVQVENSAVVDAKTCSTRLTAVADSSLAEKFVHVRDLDPDRVPGPPTIVSTPATVVKRFRLTAPDTTTVLLFGWWWQVSSVTGGGCSLSVQGGCHLSRFLGTLILTIFFQD